MHFILLYKEWSSDRHTSFSVSGGFFSATINPRDALALHTGARGSERTAVTVAVTLDETATTTYGEVKASAYTLDFL